MGLLDRSSALRWSWPTAPMSGRIEVIAVLRRLRMTGAEIAECLGMALSTVSGILTRLGLGKLSVWSRLEPPQPVSARARPGELIHIDVKKLGRIHGGASKALRAIWQRDRQSHEDAGERSQAAPAGSSCTSAVDDATRLAYVEVLTDEKAPTAVGFLRRAVAFYARSRHHRAAT